MDPFLWIGVIFAANQQLMNWSKIEWILCAIKEEKEWKQQQFFQQAFRFWKHLRVGQNIQQAGIFVTSLSFSFKSDSNTMSC